MEEREIIEYQNLLKYIAGESKEGQLRMKELQKRKDEFLMKYGDRNDKKRIGRYFKKKSNQSRSSQQDEANSVQ
jgi:hypothetical protein